MQTFLPYADFAESARVLDTPRLGKQRVEVIQILKSLTVPGYAWRQHPAVLQWEGHLEALVRYGLAMTDEWVARGHADSCAPQFAPLAGLESVRTQPELAAAGLLPSWLGDEAFHLPHRSSLLRKDPEHYRPHFGDVPDDLPYLWPRRSPAVLEREHRARERLAAQAARMQAELDASRESCRTS